ncbi:MAG: hypothetical protein ACRDD8_09675 [Bacteroidales bacterium]
MDINVFLPYLAAGVSGLFGWIVGKRKQDNNFISDLQASINLLSKDNKEVREELISVRREYAKQSALLEKISAENKLLKEQIDVLTKRLS